MNDLEDFFTQLLIASIYQTLIGAVQDKCISLVEKALPEPIRHLLVYAFEMQKYIR